MLERAHNIHDYFVERVSQKIGENVINGYKHYNCGQQIQEVNEYLP